MAKRYTFSETGCSIFGSFETFNRVLYGGHSGDDSPDRFFTFAGDTPLFMGATSDYMRDTWCYQAKNGVLFSGLCMTPGFSENPARDIYGKYFHLCDDIESVWHHGYLTYRLSRFSSYFPAVDVRITVLPLQDEDGFLVSYDITTDQRIFFAAGFGGVTAPFGRFEYHNSAGKDYSPADSAENSAELISCGAAVRGHGTEMLIGSSFKAIWELDAPDALTEPTPSTLLNAHEGEKCVAKCRYELKPGERFTGKLIILKNSSEARLLELLNDKKLEKKTKNSIRKKYAASFMQTPELILDSAFSDLQIALDASFHGNTFYHGAIGYHAPFLGWRGWYGNTLTGPRERVRKAILTHFDTMLFSDLPEKVWYDGADRPDLDHVGTQYHHLENPSGRIPALLHRDDIYDMQQVAVDMTLFYLEATGDLETGKAIYERLEAQLDHQERIYDPDGDGIYQSFLNTWISDGHCYNGGGCAQASAYNYYANLRAASLGRALGLPYEKFQLRAEKIRKALREKLYLPEEGILAEHFDTVGNRLLHKSPELSTLYLAGDCELFSDTEMHRILKFAENNIESVVLPDRKGRLYYSSNWKPKKYSTCGIFTAENACLALAFYRNGEAAKGFEILTALMECWEKSFYPGSLTHVLSASGAPDGGDIDFTDVSGCIMRLLCEGLWGVSLRQLENEVRIAPRLPQEWKNASLSLPGLKLEYLRDGHCTKLILFTDIPGRKRIDLPFYHAGVEQLLLNGEEITFESVPSFDAPRLRFETSLTGRIEIQLYENDTPLPRTDLSRITLFPGSRTRVQLTSGTVREFIMPESRALWQRSGGNGIILSAGKTTGKADGLLLAEAEDALLYLPVVLEIPAEETAAVSFPAAGKAESVDLSGFFNCEFTKIHEQSFMSPRPAGYSIGMQKNGRYAWEWNHFGHNGFRADDSALRSCGGVWQLPDGSSFRTPEAGCNTVCVSVWENFPTEVTVPVSGRAAGLELFLCGTTNAMQSFVENGRIILNYADGTAGELSLVHPVNFDDFLVAALQKEFDYFYFSEGNHGIICRIPADPAKEIRSFTVRAVANEVIIALFGANIIRI